MSEPGPYLRTRAASRASRESTPSARNPLRRSERATLEPTPAATRRIRARNTNQPTPAAHDGDDALPPVSNKDSKAYGSSGKLTGPAPMDVRQAFKRADLAIDTAVSQASARGAGRLPSIADNATEMQTRNIDPLSQDASRRVRQIEHGGPHGKEYEHTLVGPPEISTWAPRAADEEPPPGNFSRILHGVWNAVTALLLTIYHGITTFLMNRSKFDWTFGLALLTLTYFTVDILYGPIFPQIDSANMRALRPATGPYFAAPPIGSVTRFQGIEDRMSYLERNIHNFFSAKPKSELPPQINWFEIGQGAIIDPYLTSPSLASKDEFTWATFFGTLFMLQPHRSALVEDTRGPTEALKHWNDGGLDRWCAPSSRGKLQVTVITARAIAPKELVVEHIAKDATILVGMAPREMELWIDVQEPEAFYELERAILASEPTLLDVSSPQPERELDPAQALPDTFLPIARFYYDIHSNQAVQNFVVQFDLAAMDIKTSRLAVRANSNWGSYDATCLNRVRLHGADMSGEQEELDLSIGVN